MPASPTPQGTMDRDDLGREPYASLVEEAFAALREGAAGGRTRGLRVPGNRYDRVSRGALYAPWPGNPDDDAFPWFDAWAVARLLAHAAPARGDRVLLLGNPHPLLRVLLERRGAVVLEGESGAREGPFARVHLAAVDEPPARHPLDTPPLADLLLPGGVLGLAHEVDSPAPHAWIAPAAGLRDLDPSVEVAGGGDFVDNGKRYLEHPAFYRRQDGSLRGLVGRLAAAARGEIRLPAAWSPESRHYTWGTVFFRRKA